MSGPMPPPVSPRIPVAHNDQLTLYAAAGMKVLAPRDWHCIEMYGSENAVLLVTPRFYTADTAPGFRSLVSLAVEVLFLSDENSGRDQVAEVLSRLFPLKHQFIHDTAEVSEPRPSLSNRPTSDGQHCSPHPHQGTLLHGSRDN